MTCRECPQEFKAYNTIERLCPTCRGKKIKYKNKMTGTLYFKNDIGSVWLTGGRVLYRMHEQDYQIVKELSKYTPEKEFSEISKHLDRLSKEGEESGWDPDSPCA